MPLNSANNSEINKFFANKSVFITGATGLVGKVLVFKLLLSIESIKRVYILIREKNGKTFKQRFEDLITKSRDLFTYLDSGLLEKLTPIQGDVGITGLGLSESDANTIINNVSIVFHSAADITFNTDLKRQLLINVGGTKNVIDFCRKFKKLDSIVYVSTAYSNPSQLVIEEKVYKNPTDAYQLLELARKNEIKDTEKYLEKFSNTYLLTKNLAENLVSDEYNAKHIPICIVRPGIVCPSYREPVRGWVDSLNGITGAVLMGGVGLARTGRGDMDAHLDPIPVDIVANTCIAAAWVTSTKYKSELRVYNCNSACLGAPDAYSCQFIAYEYAINYPLLKTIRPVAKPTNWFHMLPVVFHLTRFFSETCFAVLCDIVLLCIGEKRFVLKLMKRMHKTHDILQCLINRKWYFTNNCFVQLSQDLIGADKTTFDCDVRQIDWVESAIDGFFTARKIFLKETDEDIIRAQTRIKYVIIGYAILNHILLSILWYLLLSFTSIQLWFVIIMNGYNITAEMIGYTLIFASFMHSFLKELFFKRKRDLIDLKLKK